AAPPSAPPAFSVLTATRLSAFMMGLRLALCFFFRAAIMIRMCDSVLGRGLLSLHFLTRVTATAAPTASAPSPAPATAAFALIACAVQVAAFRLSQFRRLSRFTCFHWLFNFFFRFPQRGHKRSLLRSKDARGFRRMHLLATIDHIGLLPCHGGIGRYGDDD